MRFFRKSMMRYSSTYSMVETRHTITTVFVPTIPYHGTFRRHHLLGHTTTTRLHGRTVETTVLPCQEDWQRGRRAPSWGWVSTCQALVCLVSLVCAPPAGSECLLDVKRSNLLCSLSFSWLYIPKCKRTCWPETRRY